MKLPLASLCFTLLLLFAMCAVGQNNAYSSYYSYTVTANADGSANVTLTAEVTGIDDVSDWVEGSYRPLCTVRPKIQLTGDASWVGGTRVALGRAVDQVRTGQPMQVPDGSVVSPNFAVEADVSCSGAPNPTYYQYPSLAYLISWSNIQLYYWSLEGFEPAQYNPPYNIAYCPSAAYCPVNYGVASIKNFVNFADFWNFDLEWATTLVKMTPGTEKNCFYSQLFGWFCDYDTVTWCTPQTTPPDYNPTGVHDVPKASPSPAYYWVTHAFGISYTGGPPYTYYGLIPDYGYPGPDNQPRAACTKKF